MDLLEKASIILTPTAYNNGEALCVKPSDGSGDFDFSRNSAATRVNAQGLVENVQILSSNLVQNGDFSEEGSEEVSNGSFSQEGVQLITNGSFDTDSDWDLGNGWSIGGGEAVALNSASGQRLSQDNILQVGKIYKLTYEVKSISSGGFKAFVGGVALQAISNIGVYTEIMTTPTINDDFFIRTLGTTSGSIDNVSCVEVGQDWSFGTGWSVGEDKVVAVNGNSYGTFQGGVTQTNKKYKVTYTIEDYISGTVNLRMHTLNLQTRNSNGTFTEYFTSVGSSIYIQGGNNFNGSITNISVKEVGQNWNLGTGVIIANSKLTKNDPSVGNTSASQGAVFTVGKTYKYKLVVSGNLTASDKVVGFFTDFTSAGTYEGYFTANTTSLVFSLRGSTNIYSIDSVSVIEITDDTNLPRINYEGFSYQDALGSEEIVNGGFDTNLNNWVAYSNTLISWESGGYALLDSNNNYWCKIKQSNVFEIGKTYKVILTAKSDRTDLSFHNSPITGSFSEADTFETFEQYYTATTTDFLFGYANAGSATITIDNVSVKEYLGQEVVPDSGCGSWLWEPQSTNTVTYSEDFINVSWGKANSPTLISGELAPNGTLSATKISGTIGSSYIALAQSSSETATRSIYAKTVSGTGTAKLMSYHANTNNLFTLTEEWQRFELTGTTTTAGNTSFYVDFRSNSQTLNEFIIWGAQSEELTYATSYIPTSGSTVTRNQDVCTNGGSLASINSTEGTLYAEIAALRETNDNVQFLSLGSGSYTSNSVYLQLRAAPNQFAVWAYSNNLNQLADVFTVTDITDFNKIAISYKLNDFKVYVNGAVVYTNTTYTPPTDNSLNVLEFTRDGSSPFYGKTKALAVWKEALSDSELQSLTTI